MPIIDPFEGTVVKRLIAFDEPLSLIPQHTFRAFLAARQAS